MEMHNPISFQIQERSLILKFIHHIHQLMFSLW